MSYHKETNKRTTIASPGTLFSLRLNSRHTHIPCTTKTNTHRTPGRVHHVRRHILSTCSTYTTSQTVVMYLGHPEFLLIRLSGTRLHVNEELEFDLYHELNMFVEMSEENWLACEPAWHRGELIYEKNTSCELMQEENSSHELIHEKNLHMDLFTRRFHLINTLSR